MQEVQTWAERLRQLREARGLSRGELAALAGVSSTTIWRIEGGKLDPQPVSKRRIVRALGYSDEDSFFTTPLRSSAAGQGKTAAFVSNVEGFLDELRSSEANLLPVYRSGACGDPRDALSAPDPADRRYPPIGTERLLGPGSFGVVIKGDSLSNRRIRDGDVVYINPALQCRRGRVVLARTWDVDDADLGMVVKVWRGGDGMGDQLWGDGDGEEGRNPVQCARYELIGPVVWVEPQGFPPD